MFEMAVSSSKVWMGESAIISLKPSALSYDFHHHHHHHYYHHHQSFEKGESGIISPKLSWVHCLTLQCYARLVQVNTMRWKAKEIQYKTVQIHFLPPQPTHDSYMGVSKRDSGGVLHYNKTVGVRIPTQRFHILFHIIIITIFTIVVFIFTIIIPITIMQW